MNKIVESDLGPGAFDDMENPKYTYKFLKEIEIMKYKQDIQLLWFKNQKLLEIR